ncbi:RNA polymerase II transcription factor B subunit 5 [Beauveria bassiana]|nr:RNA polymerase II transcription factor B subunit 5 [Beauveria bassiana]
MLFTAPHPHLTADTPVTIPHPTPLSATSSHYNLSPHPPTLTSIRSIAATTNTHYSPPPSSTRRLSSTPSSASLFLGHPPAWPFLGPAHPLQASFSLSIPPHHLALQIKHHTPTFHKREAIMPRAIRSVLIECDPSIKSIIVNIDSENHDFIIEDLDEERVVVKENMVPLLKQKLEDRLKENLPPIDESGSE